MIFVIWSWCCERFCWIERITVDKLRRIRFVARDFWLFRNFKWSGCFYGRLILSTFVVAIDTRRDRLRCSCLQHLNYVYVKLFMRRYINTRFIITVFNSLRILLIRFIIILIRLSKSFLHGWCGLLLIITFLKFPKRIRKSFFKVYLALLLSQVLMDISYALLNNQSLCFAIYLLPFGLL